ncbi:MAG: pyridoxine 5'-phosphate synthase [bacterium]
MIELGVNVDHVATLREARGISIPDPVQAAAIAEQNGADLITVHLRMDRRHIQDRDLDLLVKTVKTGINLEMAVNEEMVARACRVKPLKVTLVPENRQEVTTEGGLDVAADVKKIKEAVSRLQEAGILVSLFLDPDLKQLKAAQKCGADGVELHTGEYAETPAHSEKRESALQRLENAVIKTDKYGMEVYAGHGLNYWNVKPVAALPHIAELNIGHAIVARSIFTGFAAAVKEMKELITGTVR